MLSVGFLFEFENDGMEPSKRYSFRITQPFWETRDRRLDKKTSTIHDLNHTGKKTNRGSSGLDSEYLVFVPHVKEVRLGHSSQIHVVSLDFSLNQPR